MILLLVRRFLCFGLLFSALTSADEVTMSFGERIPPFCFPETNTGIELEVIGEALAVKGHKLVPKYYTFARIPVAFKLKQVNAAMTDLGEDLTAFGGHYGQPAVWYDNVFITLKERNLSIKTPADLKGLSVISFHGARKRYPDWLEPLAADGKYVPINDQEKQVLMLMNKRVDVVLSDRSIFKYFSKQLLSSNRLANLPAVTEHKFTEVDLNNYRPIFRSKRVRDDFNFGYQKIKNSGRLQAIYDKYLK